jgi:hypothetical protein
MEVKEEVKRGSKNGSYAQAQDDRVESWNKGIMGQRNLEVRKSVNQEIHTSAVHEQTLINFHGQSPITSSTKCLTSISKAY